MRIGISGAFVNPGRVGGAEHAFYNLVQGLRQVAQPADEWRLYVQRALADRRPVDPLVAHRVPAPTNTSRILAETLLVNRAREVDSWLFPAYFTPYGVRGHVVTVVHDAQFRHLPQNFGARKRAWMSHAHARTLRRADVVVAISEAVAADLSARHGSSDRIQVIPNPVSFDRFTAPGRPTSVAADTSYVLCVSAQWRHKNLATLVAAFGLMSTRDPALRLVVAGQVAADLLGAKQADDVRDLAARAGLTERVDVLGYIGDDELGRLYRHASVVAVPSLFEGFGLPVVEALGLGAPVVASDIPALREVALGLAHHIANPLDPGAWADALLDAVAHRDRLAPTPAAQARVRKAFDPVRVASSYARALGLASELPVPAA